MAQISLLWGFGISSVNLSMLISKKHQRYANSAMAKMTANELTSPAERDLAHGAAGGGFHRLRQAGAATRDM
jgi:hypothetical protein